MKQIVLWKHLLWPIIYTYKTTITLVIILMQKKITIGRLFYGKHQQGILSSYYHIDINSRFMRWLLVVIIIKMTSWT